MVPKTFIFMCIYIILHKDFCFTLPSPTFIDRFKAKTKDRNTSWGEILNGKSQDLSEHQEMKSGSSHFSRK